MKEMEKSILEAGGETGRVYENHTHSITEKEHQFFLELQESWKNKRKKKRINKIKRKLLCI